jgi:hypothetical protein
MARNYTWPLRHLHIKEVQNEGKQMNDQPTKKQSTWILYITVPLVLITAIIGVSWILTPTSFEITTNEEGRRAIESIASTMKTLDEENRNLSIDLAVCQQYRTKATNHELWDACTEVCFFDDDLTDNIVKNNIFRDCLEYCEEKYKKNEEIR